MVTRGDPDEEELVVSARYFLFIKLLLYFSFSGICSNCVDDPVKNKLAPYFKPLAAAYKKICDEQMKLRKSFFGLRDFYRLAMLQHHCSNHCMHVVL